MRARDIAERLVNDRRTPPALSRTARSARDQLRGRTSTWRVLPDFVILGAHKGGTTSLYDLLADHPQVVPAFEKEVHYFDVRYDGIADSYRQSFPTRRRMERVASETGKAITGEASPYYLSQPHVPKRFVAMLPEAKAIALLRNPVDRAVSAFHHNRVRTPNEPLETFAEAVDRELTLLAGERERVAADEGYPDREYAWHCYLQRGVYVDQLRCWHEVLPCERLLVLQSERLGAEPGAVLDEVGAYLGIERWQPPSFTRSNTNEYPAVPSDLRTFLEDWFRPHNERLYEYLGVDFGW